MDVKEKSIFNSTISIIMAILAWGAITYHMVATQILFISSIEHQIVHLAFVITLIALSSALTIKKKSSKWFWMAIVILGLISTGYIMYFYDHLEEVIGFPDNVDVVMGSLLVILVIICTWKSWGMTFPIITIACLLYFFLGHLLPQPFFHPKFDFAMVVGYLSISFRGIFGPFLAFMANFGFLLVFFGALLELMGANQFFLEMGKLGGKVTYAGPAHTAVVGSSLVGMASGSAIGNVIITGSFTIPTMKKSGYSAEAAGAIESVASTGSQIMPPIMGSSVFLMAGFLGKPYAEIMIAGIIPALLYYFGVGSGVELWARKNRIDPPKEKVDYKIIYARCLSFVVPLGFLTTLLIMHKSAGMASFWAIILVLFFGFIQTSTRPSLQALSSGIVKGVIGAAKISIVIAAVAMIAQTFISTGLGTKVAYAVQYLSGDNLYIMLLMTMVFSIILGCGMPTMAAYALMAILVAPSLVNAGISMFQAHFFCFYFAILAAVTPPVALASLAAASIAEADYYKTGVLAFKFAFSGFIIPYFVVFNPSILMQLEGSLSPILSISSAFLAVLFFTIGIAGYLLYQIGFISRTLIFINAFLFCGYVITIKPALFYIGIILSLFSISWQIWKKKTEKDSVSGKLLTN
ncbi:MAG TPA: TRAP transporter fused permease subunit [Desulfobacterales bacterium]|nr:TRAP transporter fused permease subunit [Desulfobacterales bacterium]